MKKFEFLGKTLGKDKQKSITGGQSCTYTWQDSQGVWHTEHGTCSAYYTGSGLGVLSGTDFVGYCHTASHTQPTSLTSNGGVSRCS